MVIDATRARIAVPADLDFGIELISSRAAEGQRAGFLVLAAMLASFLFIRTSARMIRAQVRWWPGNVQTAGGLHIHHLVWGICLLMAVGFLQFALSPPSPWVEVLAVLFGIGAGLTLDEFALWLRLQDVYWSQEGRESIDAVVVATLFAGLILLGLSPFDADGAGSTAGLAVAVTAVLLLAAVTILKGKVVTGVVGVFVPVFALIGALRLAKPGSPWARRRYRDDVAKSARARARNARLGGLRSRLLDLVGGAPSDR